MLRIKTLGLGLCLMLALAAASRSADAPAALTIDLWPGQAPGENGAIGEEKAEKTADGKAIARLTNVTKPTLTVYRPEADTANGMAVVVCPGGGYSVLAWDHEGEQVARWLNSIGVTAALLKYRVPRRADTPKDQPPPQALMDAQRAVSLVRSKAADWGLDPKRIGMLGFSAGGHLTAWASTNFDRRAYEAVDAADKVDSRPDFAIMIYPGGVIKKGAEQLNPEIRVTSQTPPSFLVHAINDKYENSIALAEAIQRAGVPVELHLYASGGHGFGMRPTGKPCSAWPRRCEEWLRDQGLLTR